MLTSSAKSKGRNLQKYVRDKILTYFRMLTDNDVRSTSMGSQGEDIQLSPFARSFLTVAIECKSHAKYAVYKDYEQAKKNSNSHEPILVIKQNSDKPLAIMDLEYWLKLESAANE